MKPAAPSNVSGCEQTGKRIPDRICAVPLWLLQVPGRKLKRYTTRECLRKGRQQD